MTKEEYAKQKDSIDREYRLIDNWMNSRGYGKYKDGSGDYGTRRLYKHKKLVSEIVIYDMVPCCWTGEYPDIRFYDKVIDKEITLNDI